MNLLADLLEGLAKGLASEGISFDPAAPQTDPILFLAAYMEFDGRRIRSSPRVVRISHELQSSPEWTSHQAAIQHLAQLCAAGDSLQPYQSTRISLFDANDLLLSDWNIQHLHLGPHTPGQLFAHRTGPLLYATFFADEAYFIAVMDHKSFSEIGLLEIIEANWPRYLDPFTLKGVQGLHPQPSSNDVHKLRYGGVQSAVALKSGRCVAALGGGYTTAGTSIAHMLEAQRIVRLLRNAETFVRDNEAELRNQLNVPDKATIRLAGVEPTRVVLTADGATALVGVPIAR